MSYRPGQVLRLAGDPSGIKCRVDPGGKTCTTIPGGDSKWLAGRQWRKENPMNWRRFSNPIAAEDPCASIFAMRNVLLVGSPADPGSGWRLARRCHAKLPPLTAGEREQLTALYQIARILGPGDEVTDRPFRAPHHTVSGAGLVGGGGGSVGARPGEVSLANHGTLYLDELNEFRREAISTLAATLRLGRAVLGYKQPVVFPAQPFLLIGSVQKLDARAENYAKMLGMGIVQETVRRTT